MLLVNEEQTFSEVHFSNGPLRILIFHIEEEAFEVYLNQCPSPDFRLLSVDVDEQLWDFFGLVYRHQL
jgi:hypothetical protein